MDEACGAWRRRRRKGAFRTAPLVLALCLPQFLRADAAYLAELTDAAERAALARSPQWHALLHYYPDRFGGGVTGEADRPDFFLAPNGKTDPDAELRATLEAFFAPAGAESRDGSHPQCAFRARYCWLRDELGFDPGRLPEQPCPEFEEWFAALRPVSITLVFPEAYMNNPSSMFGHTLLRIDNEDSAAGGDLLAYATNFAADPGGDGGVTFAWKGVFGFYPGLFSIDPYYEKATRYGDWEQRDIWEYRLDLRPEEMQRLVEHLWELRGVNFDYYFFDENCSYHILGLLEAARPGLRLRERFPLYAIPADTVRAVAEAGLVASARFRASATTILRHEAGLLGPSERALAVAIARGEAPLDDARLGAMTDERRALILTVAHDYLRHSYLASQVGREPAVERARQILIARSKVPVLGEPPPPPEPAVRPDQGHETARLAVAAGWRAERGFVEAAIRPAFHDLLDAGGGYTRGAAIDFLDTTLRLYPDRGELRLQDLALVDIVSLAPRDDLFQPWSWRVNTRVASVLAESSRAESGLDGVADRYAWRTNGGPGLAYDLWGAGIGYGFLAGTFDVGPRLRDSHAAALGGEVGFFTDLPSDRWKAHLFAEAAEFALGERRTAFQAGAAQRFRWGANRALRAEVAFHHEFGEDWLEGSLGVQWYF